METADLVIAHPDPVYAARITNFLTNGGFRVLPSVRDAREAAKSSVSIVLVESSLLSSDFRLNIPIIIIAPANYRPNLDSQILPEAILYEPLDVTQIEDAVWLVQRRMDANLERSRADSMVRSVRHRYGLFLLDATGAVVLWNSGAAALHGYAEADVVGKHVSMLYSEEDRAAGVPDSELQVAAKDGYADDTRLLAHRDGKRFWAETLTSAVTNRAGEVIGYAKVTRDATARRKLEEQLERSDDELRRFAYAVSHDLQEPLRTVRSYAELLNRRYAGKLDKDADDFIHFVTDAAARMSQLLRDVLDYSQAGRPDRTNPEPTSAAVVLQWAIMNVDTVAKETGAAITFDPLPMVEADQTQLSRVFQNLLGNSLKYRSAEPPRIHVSAQRAGDSCEFAVRDNGIGVAPEHHGRIFGVFKRLHGKEVPGTGIGLAICRKIVESHGGRIWIESEAGRGATFKFTLPASD